MEVLPGTECQVDYGTGAWIVGADGKRRKTHLFRVVLSCSRKAYYSVPPEYTRREVWVRHDGRLVEVFSDAMDRLCVHAQKEPGQRSTRREHIPPEKIANPELGNEWMLRKAWNIGDGAHAWAKAMLAERGIPGIRVLNGLLCLRKKHKAAAINTGCTNALEAQEFSLKGLQRHIANATEKQESFDFIADHPLIRATAEYEQITNSKGLFQ